MAWVDTAQGVGAVLGATAFFWEAGRLTWTHFRRPRAEIHVVAHEGRIPDGKVVAARLAVTTKGRPAASIKIAVESWNPNRGTLEPDMEGIGEQRRMLERLSVRQPRAVSEKHLVVSRSPRPEVWKDYDAVDQFTVDSVMDLFVPYYQFADTLFVDIGTGRREEIFDPHQHEIDVYVDVFLTPEGGKRSHHRFHLYAQMDDQPKEHDEQGNTIAWAPGRLECRLLEEKTKEYRIAEESHPRNRSPGVTPRPRGPPNR